MVTICFVCEEGEHVGSTLGKVSAYNITVAIGTMLCIRSPEHIHLIAESCEFLAQHFPVSPSHNPWQLPFYHHCCERDYS